MSCPACQASVDPGLERCPACGTMVAPAVHGALAPDPARHTPPRTKMTPQRDAPGLRRREASWKDEVRERVQRRRKKGAGDLPLFDASAAPAAAPLELPGPGTAPVLEAEPAPAAEPSSLPGPSLLGDEPDASEPASGLAFQLRAVGDAPTTIAADLPLRGSGAGLLIEAPEPADPVALARSAPLLDEALAEPDDWAPRVGEEPPPVERPARFAERLKAGAVDLGLLGVLYGIVLYFASRTAQADLSALFRAWPWLVGYLVFLGLAYAVWFTGTTGQTPGKMVLGLRVVERCGQPPGYARALARAACGAVSSAVLGLGVLPLFFDPARRALHDRLLHTRVVKF